MADPNPGSIGILLGAGDGTLRPVQNFPGGYRPTAIAVGDFNHDGKLDLAVAGYGSDSTGGNPGSVSILLGREDGTFQAPVVVSSFAGLNAISIVASDFNGDGRMDLAVGTFKYPNATPTVSVLLGRGDGTFQPAVNYPLASSTGSNPAQLQFLTAGDLNGDGKPELVALIFDSDSAWKISILPGNGDGTFGPATFKPTDFGPAHAVITDLNGDGLPDLVVAHCCGDTDATYLIGNGDGTFQDEVHFPSGPSPTAIAVTDFDGDGRPDLAIAGQTDVNGTGTVVAMLNRFLAAPAAAVNVAGRSVQSRKTR